jgi:hypothetical protein
MTEVLEANSLLPGLMPRAEWARKAINKCDATAKRMQDAGQIVVVYIGREPYVHLEKTAARLQGEDRERRGRRAA